MLSVVLALLVAKAPVAPAACPPGQVRGRDTAGHCCWPKQAWSVALRRCVGAPQCPESFTEAGGGCACPAGQVVSADTAGRCCWPTQAWSSARLSCVGAPACPATLKAEGEQCVALAAAPAPPPTAATASKPSETPPPLLDATQTAFTEMPWLVEQPLTPIDAWSQYQPTPEPVAPPPAPAPVPAPAPAIDVTPWPQPPKAAPPAFEKVACAKEMVWSDQLGVCVHRSGPAAPEVLAAEGQGPAGASGPRIHSAPWFLFAGLGAFAAGYLPGLLLPPLSGDHNPNANRSAAIPLAGPFLVRSAASDYSLNQGLGALMLTAGVLQIAGAAGIVGGSVAWAIGREAPPRMTFFVGPQGGSVAVTW